MAGRGGVGEGGGVGGERKSLPARTPLLAASSSTSPWYDARMLSSLDRSFMYLRRRGS